MFPFRRDATKYRVSSTTMPPKKSIRTQLYITDIHGSDDTLEAAASTAKRATPTLSPEAGINDDDDDDLYV